MTYGHDHRRVVGLVAGCLATLALLSNGIAVSAEQPRWAFAGFYELGETTDMGDHVMVQLSLRVFSYSDADVAGATLTLDDPLLPEKDYGVFPNVTVAAGESVRLSDRFLVPRVLYDAWQTGEVPTMRIDFTTTEGTVRGPVALSRGPVDEGLSSCAA